MSFKTLLLCTLAGAALSATPPIKKKKKFIDPANMDLSVKPGDDFYQYANGNWIRNNPVPPSKTRWGSFNELQEESLRRMRILLEEAAAEAGKTGASGAMAGAGAGARERAGKTDGSGTASAHKGDAGKEALYQKIGDFYTSGMDSATLESLGDQPIRADIDRIAAIRDMDGLFAEIVYERIHGISSSVLSFSIEQDPKNVTEFIPQIGQRGITLPDRDYYLKNDVRSRRIREAYRTHLHVVFGMIGKSPEEADRATDAILRIETALAKAQMTRVELRDPYKTYNKFSWAALNAITPSIDWKGLAAGMQIRGVDSVLSTNPVFLKAVDLLITAVPLQDWKDYLEWNVLEECRALDEPGLGRRGFQLWQGAERSEGTNAALAKGQQPGRQESGRPAGAVVCGAVFQPCG